MNIKPIFWALLAALCYGLSAPVAKLLLVELSPTFMAALLYLGAGLGMLAVNMFQGEEGKKQEASVTRKDLPFIVAMVALDIAAPIFLMLGLSKTNPATVSLLNNFEIVATTMIALILFKEAVGKRMWVAIGFILVGSLLLSIKDFSHFSFSLQALLVLLACLCWGFENNCTRMLSLKNPMQIVIIKGLGSGLGALAIAFFTHSIGIHFKFIMIALLLGFVSYGLSIYFYILAQRHLGAARTSSYYAFAPFIGVGLSFIVFKEMPSPSFFIALAIMAVGAYFTVSEKHKHVHQHTSITHEHRHRHGDGHHTHTHEESVHGEHSHFHTHEETTHSHAHLPDLHHVHEHGIDENHIYEHEHSEEGDQH